MVDRPFDRGPLRVDGDRVQHQAEDAVAVGEGAQLCVREVARMVVDGAAARVRDADAALVRCEALVEELRRCVRQIEHDPRSASTGSSERPSRESPPSSAAPSANGFRRFHVSPAIRRPELPEEVGAPELVAERLDALEREHQADSLAALDEVEVGSRPHRHDPIRVLAHGAMERGRLAERRAERSLGLPLELDEDRADLKADAAGFEERQPRPARRRSSRRAGARGARAPCSRSLWASAITGPTILSAIYLRMEIK